MVEAEVPRTHQEVEEMEELAAVVAAEQKMEDQVELVVQV